MDDIPSDLYAKIAADCAGSGIFWIRLTQHHATSLHDIQTFPNLRATILLRNRLKYTNIWFFNSAIICLRKLRNSLLYVLALFHYDMITKLTIGTTGPELMYVIKPGKKGLDARSA